MSVTPEAVAREALATIALSFVGQGDVHERVWLDVLRPPTSNPVQRNPATGGTKPLSWCRAWALHCLREWYRAATGSEPPRAWIWRPGQGFERPLELPFRGLPTVGDVAYRTRGQHGAIVVRVRGDGTVDTVDGNSFDGQRYGVVALHERTPINDWTGFWGAERMLAEGLAARTEGV